MDLSVMTCSINGIDPRIGIVQSLWHQFFLTALQSQIINSGFESHIAKSTENEGQKEVKDCGLTIGLRMCDERGKPVTYILKHQLSQKIMQSPAFRENLPAIIFQSWLKTWEHVSCEFQPGRTYVLDHLLFPNNKEIELYLSIV